MAVRERAAAGFHQEGVCVPMIAAVELDDLIASGERAREPDARHRRFRAAVHHPHFLDRGHPIADQFRHLQFQRIRNSKTQSARRSVADRLEHNFRRMPKNRRSPTPHVIDVFISIHVPDPCAFPARDEKRVTANISKRAYRRIDAGRDGALRAREQFFVAGHRGCSD